MRMPIGLALIGTLAMTSMSAAEHATGLPLKRESDVRLGGGKALLVDAHGSREVQLAADAVFSSKAIAWHEFTNVGNTTIRVLIVENKYEPVAATGR